MKDLFKKIVKPLLIISFVLLFSCEKDLYEEHIKKPNRGETTLLTGIEAEKVSQRLKKLLGTQSSISDGGYTKTFSLNLGTISYDEILKVIDAMGKENYSFKVERPESSDSKFYNVVLQEEDETTVIKLIEFSMDSDFADDFKVNQDLLKFKGTIKFTPVYNDSPCPEPEVIIQIGDIPSQHYQTGGGGSTNNEHNTSSPIVTGNGGHGNGLSLLLLLTHSGGSSNTTTTSNIGAGNYTCPPNFHYDPKVHDCMPDARVDKMEVGPTVLIEGDPTVPPAEPVDQIGRAHV